MKFSQLSIMTNLLVQESTHQLSIMTCRLVSMPIHLLIIIVDGHIIVVHALLPSWLAEGVITHAHCKTTTCKSNNMAQRLRAPGVEEAEKLRQGVFMISSILSTGAPGPSRSPQQQHEGT